MNIEIRHGFYLLPRISGAGEWDMGHSFFLDVGNVTKRFNDYHEVQPPLFMIHMDKIHGYQEIPFEYYRQKANKGRGYNLNDFDWNNIQEIKDIQQALFNINEFLSQNGNQYDAWFRNCEHFTSYVITGGKKTSITKQAVVGSTLMVGLVAAPFLVDLGKLIFGNKNND